MPTVLPYKRRMSELPLLCRNQVLENQSFIDFENCIIIINAFTTDCKIFRVGVEVKMRIVMRICEEYQKGTQRCVGQGFFILLKVSDTKKQIKQVQVLRKEKNNNYFIKRTICFYRILIALDKYLLT